MIQILLILTLRKLRKIDLICLPECIQSVLTDFFTYIRTDSNLQGICFFFIFILNSNNKDYFIIARTSNKIKKWVAVSNCVSAEFRNPSENPDLYRFVKRFMIHISCGIFLSESCLHAERKNDYPKTFNDETIYISESWFQISNSSLCWCLQILNIIKLMECLKIH